MLPEIKKTNNRFSSRKKNLGYKIVERKIVEWTKGIQVGIALFPQFYSARVNQKSSR